MLRKILAVCITDRVVSRLDHQTPITQAAYRKERSTTEHVFAAKMATQQTINTKNETLPLVLFNMSKAFDSIKRKDLIKHLQHTIAVDVLVKKMLGVSLVVRYDVETASVNHSTLIQVHLKETASASNFTYYLAKSLEVKTPDAIIHDHHCHHQSITSHEMPDELT